MVNSALTRRCYNRSAQRSWTPHSHANGARHVTEPTNGR